MRHPIFVLGLIFNVHRCSLARATGPFSSHGRLCHVQRERRANHFRDNIGKETYMFPVDIYNSSFYSMI